MMRRRPLLMTGLAMLIVAVPVGVQGAPVVRKSQKKDTKKATKKATPKLVSNRAQWPRYQGRVVKRIEITGLKRTKRWRLKHWLDTRAGQPFDAYTLYHDIRRIRNLQLFRPVRVRVDPEGKGVVVRIQTRDKWSLLPYFNGFLNLGTALAITGIYDVNTLGYLSYVDLQVMLFSYLPITAKSIRPGFLFVLGVPRLGRLPLSYYLQARAQMSLRAILSSLYRPAGYFRTERYGGYHSLTWEPYQWLRVGVRHTLYYNRYRDLPHAVALGEDVTPVPRPPDGLTHSFALTGQLGYTRYRDYMQHGLVMSWSLEGATTRLGSDTDFVRFSGEVRGYYDLGSRGGNLVTRLGGGYMKGGDFSNRFILGSWTGLRGFATAHYSGRAYAYGNVEYRTGLWRQGFPIASIIPYFRGKVFQLQGAVFADMGAVFEGGAYRTDEHGRPLVAIGAGIRAAVVNLYKAILRIDFAYTLSPFRYFDVIVATQQFF